MRVASLLDPIGAVDAAVVASVVMALHCLHAQGFSRRSDGPVEGLTGPVCGGGEEGGER